MRSEHAFFMVKCLIYQETKVQFYWIQKQNFKGIIFLVHVFTLGNYQVRDFKGDSIGKHPKDKKNIQNLLESYEIKDTDKATFQAPM